MKDIDKLQVCWKRVLWYLCQMKELKPRSRNLLQMAIVPVFVLEHVCFFLNGKLHIDWNILY